MEYFDVIRQRYSVRAYKPDAVEDEKLRKVLEAARLAPTACNLQAFRVVVMRTADHEVMLKKICRASFFTQAPLVLGIYADTADAWVRADGKTYADVDAAIVMDHIILAATALDLGTCWIGAFNADAAREAVNLSKGFEPVAFTPVGYPASNRPAKQRKPLSDIVVWM
jgi:nitroreductase